MERVSELQVNSRDLYVVPTRKPAAYGCMDTRMGISDKTSICKTCNKKLHECAGHFGYIKLELPCYHVGFFKHTLTILQCICKFCSRLLISESKRVEYRKLRDPKADALSKAATFKRVVDACKRVSKCPFCQRANGVVKKVSGGGFKIIHEITRSKSYGDVEGEYRARADMIIESNPDLKSHLLIPKKQTLKEKEREEERERERIRENYLADDIDDSRNKKMVTRAVEVLTPLKAYELFMKIAADDMCYLWMDERYGCPDTLILWTIPVPPVPIRPSVPQESGGGSTEDDITVKLQEIVEINNAIKSALEKGCVIKMIVDDWDILQVNVALLINGETPGIPRNMIGSVKTIRGLAQRLKGKQGRFRGNLSGKRVDFSGRTVISPDPNLRVDQVGVPMHIAKIMTYPEKVNRYNIEKLRKCVVNGPDVHPGAKIIRSTGNFNFVLDFGDRVTRAANLKVGDIVERHMNDDDIVLFNRQPSLHKMSIMAHRVKVFPWRTFRFNECVCLPYNADFDGDEMNMHLPQTEEARVEASELMGVTHNLITPRNGEPLVAATQDFLTAAYVMTQKDVFYTKSQFCKLVAYLSDAGEHVDLPLPTIWRPRRLWTGKQVISLLVRPNKDCKSLVNVESEEKFYTSGKHMCPKDGFVAFRRGEHLCGSLGKKTLGGESKSGLFYVLVRDFGSPEAIRCMSRLAKLSARYLGDRGFSIGIDDVTPSDRMLKLKTRILAEGKKLADEQIDAYNSGNIKLKPGCDALQSLESEVNGLLGKIRENCGREALTALDYRNAALRMAQCGSKGSPLNISQMISCLGQQSVGGARMQNGFVNRTLPHFPIGSLAPDAKGFVANSFYSGLTATEFFFHTMGGREGLVDTAVKTAETGYMARRLMKALEDLSMQYDMTVRNSEKTVIQFNYGDDSLNPQLMEKNDRPVNFGRVFTNTVSLEPFETRAKDDVLSSSQIMDVVDRELQSQRFKEVQPLGEFFVGEVRGYFAEHCTMLRQLERAQEGRPPKGIDNVALIRRKLATMSPSEKKAWRAKAVVEKGPEYYEAHKLVHDNCMRLTKAHIVTILDQALNRYKISHIEPGEAVGAVGAQSLSEPGTQMTLKTFHFAGVASMNVTLGVPRLKEIINAAKIISTPIIEARLENDRSMTSARIAKAKIEKTTLGEISEYIKEVHSVYGSYISIKLDKKAIANLHMQLNSKKVKAAILQSMPGTQRSAILRLVKEENVLVQNELKVHIVPPDPKDSKSSDKNVHKHQKNYYKIQALKAAIPNIIVQGIPTVSRAVINEEEQPGNQKSYYLLVEGYGLSEVIGCPGIKGTESKSNHIMEMQNVLGIEAARSMIASEIKYIMSAYGITVDRRHLLLLSDVMTFKGEVLGITRFGVAKMRESVLMLASFEKTTDHLYDAAVHSREDSIVGVSECIIMGVPIPLGTGIFKIMHKAEKVKPFTRTRMLETI